MAQLAGFENVFDAEVTAIAEANGTMTCHLNGAAVAIEVPLTETRRDHKVRVAIRAGDIMLAISHPQGISARNIIAGRVGEILQEGAKVIVLVDAGGARFMVHLTPKAADDLRLSSSAPVWMIVKTYSCHLVTSNSGADPE